MRRTMTLGFLAITLSSSWLVAHQSTAVTEGAKLDALLKAYQTERTAALAAPAARGGIFVDPGPTGSPEQMLKMVDAAKAFRARLAALRGDQLTHDDWVLYGIADYSARMDAENVPAFFWLSSVITPYSSGLRTIAAPFSLAPLTTQADRDAYLAALAKLPATMMAYQTRLEQQVAHGVALPAEELRLVLPMVRGLSVRPPRGRSR